MAKANGLFWVAVIMLVVELLFALLLNQVLVTMVGQTEFSQQDEKVAGLGQCFGFCFNRSSPEKIDFPCAMFSCGHAACVVNFTIFSDQKDTIQQSFGFL